MKGKTFLYLLKFPYVFSTLIPHERDLDSSGARCTKHWSPCRHTGEWSVCHIDNIERKLNVKASRTRWIFLTTIAASRHVDIPALKATRAIPVLLFSYRFYHVIVKSWVSRFFLSLFFLTCQNGYSVHLSLVVARGILQYMKGTFSPSRSTRLLFCLLS